MTIADALSSRNGTEFHADELSGGATHNAV